MYFDIYYLLAMATKTAKVCVKCKKNINARHGKPLQCDGKCRQVWHKACTSVSDEEYQEILTVPDKFWFCAPCKESRNRNRRSTINMADRTPSTPSTAKAGAASSTTEAAIVRIESKLDQLIGWQKDVITEIRGIQNTLEELRTTTETLMDEQQQLRSDNFELRRQLELNEIEIDQLRQEKLRKTLEISNVPVAEDEDLFDKVTQICHGIGVVLDISEVKEIFRAPTYQSQKSQIPPPIQLKLSSKKKRDELLAKKREKKELTTAILDKGTDKPVNIYISEVLTKRNRYLFKLARDLRRSDRIKFAWFRDGRLLVRKTEKAKVKEIRSVAALDEFTK